MSKPKSLRERYSERTEQELRDHLATVFQDLEGTVRAMNACSLNLERHAKQCRPKQMASHLLLGAVLGALLFALLQPRIATSWQACQLGERLQARWTELPPDQRQTIQEMLD